MKTDVEKDIVETFRKLNETLSKFSEDELNLVPHQGSWTAGQVTQHIILACSGFPELFAGKTKLTTRKPDEKVKDILYTIRNIKGVQLVAELTPEQIKNKGHLIFE